jgi:hypothetical protein
MQIGWIDFSKEEKDKVLSVLDLLSEKGVLDELGIAPIRDAFSNRFFPGTSTIQTRAKYFFIVSYTFKELELDDDIYPVTQKSLKDIENKIVETLLENNPNSEGIIGVNSIKSGGVKRPPSSIYWAGLRRYHIFENPLSDRSITISQYLNFLNNQKEPRINAKKLSNRRKDSTDLDDKNAGFNSKLHFFNIPNYNEKWMNNLSINLTPDEGDFLKKQIIKYCDGSMMAYILEHPVKDVLEINNFLELEKIIDSFPEKIRHDYELAVDFSKFNFVLNVIFNLEVSEGNNEDAKLEFKKIQNNINDYVDINIDMIIDELGVGNDALKDFLNRSQEFMIKRKWDCLKNHIKEREISLKGRNRSKLFNPKSYDDKKWYAGKYLDYRFSRAKIIIKDIFDSQNNIGEGNYD